MHIKKSLISGLSLVFGIIAIAGVLTAFVPYVNAGYIQNQINNANNGDVIIIPPGTYYENINFMGKAITLISADPENPDATIIDGGGSGTVVTFDNKEGNDSVLNGFTIKNGYNCGGAGINCDNSSPSILNCIIKENKTPYYSCYGGDGAGISCINSSSKIMNCIIRNNSVEGSSGGNGGGIYCTASSPKIISCIISENNTTTESGGGFYCNVGNPELTDCTISKNFCNWYGGGICSYGYNTCIKMRNCLIIENSASAGSGHGGGLAEHSFGRFDIQQCIIKDNFAYHGGGIYLESTPSIMNCIIEGNSARDGGGVYCCGSNDIINCTIYGNSSSYNGGGIHGVDGTPSITNCILWNNAPYEVYVRYGTPIVTYSDVQGGYPGVGNINQDPLFFSPSLGDFHITANTPCIDAGDPRSSVYEDMEGTPRPQDGDGDGIAICDIGAYEYFNTICEDNDDDGYTTCAEDCDDNSTAINPGATETPYDGIDQDCDGVDLTDVDGDTYDSTSVAGGTDCDDNDIAINPGATETPYDGIDQDCDGVDLTDVDGDTYDSVSVTDGTDCDDNNAAINPWATETPYDGIDQDCDGVDLTDVDGDTYDSTSVAGGTDCDDNDIDINPWVTETPYDGIDQDCDGADLTDVDGDTYDSVSVTGGTDCDDNNAAINPGATETPYDGIDQDCDGSDLTDMDNDGYDSVTVTGGTDCDDNNTTINPGATETPYDGIDQDCDGADLTDMDNDGYDSVTVTGGTDCNDNDAAINPEATELCNDGIDNNCNDLIDFYDSYCLNTDPEGGLNHLKDIITDTVELPTEWFKGNNDNRRTPMSNKIDEVITLLHAAEVETDPDLRASLYQEAFDKLSNDIMKKTNGCATSGSPDNNDWIDDCMGQDIIYPIIQNLLSDIQGLI